MKQPAYPRAFFIVYFLFFSILVCATPVHPRTPNSGALEQRSLASGTRTYQSFYARGDEELVMRPKPNSEVKASSPTQSQDPNHSKWEELNQCKTETWEDIKKYTKRANHYQKSLPPFPSVDYAAFAEDYVLVEWNIMLSWSALLEIAKLELERYPNDLSAADIKKTLTGAQNWHKATVMNRHLTEISSLEEFKEIPGEWGEVEMMMKTWMKKQGHVIDSV